MAVKAGKTTEAARISDQLHRAFHGPAWHGPALLELLEDVDVATAAARPLKNVHNIWELVLHIEAWDRAGIVRLSGKKSQPKAKDNFPLVINANESTWRRTMMDLKRTHDQLTRLVEALPDERLRDRCPGKKYDLYHLLHGIAQHELYHAGQIVVLKKATWEKVN